MDRNKFNETFDKIEANEELDSRIIGAIAQADIANSTAYGKKSSKKAPSNRFKINLARIVSVATACILALVIGLGIGLGWFIGVDSVPPGDNPIDTPIPPNNDDNRNYGNFVGVASPTVLSREEFIDLVWINNNFNWGCCDEGGSAPEDDTDSDSVNLGSPPPPGDSVYNEAPRPPGGNDHTTTNSQVDGVLEGDIIQVDSNYIYFLSHTGLNIISVRDGMRLVYRDEFNDFMPDEMHIFGDLLVVIGGEFGQFSFGGIDTFTGGARWWGRRMATRLIVYDISNRSAVKRLYDYSISGHFITSRKIGNNLIVVANHVINRTNRDRLFPMINGEELDARFVHLHDTGNLSSHLIMASLNLDSLNLSISSHMGLMVEARNSVQYFSLNNAYFFAPLSYTCDDSGNHTSHTYITKIDLNSLKSSAYTTIIGHVGNRFWVSEYRNNLRVIAQAFTTGQGNLGRHTNLFILDSNLDTINFTTHIQRGRNIHGVRFRGNTVAVDTYILVHIRIDSVALIDMSDIENPVITEGQPAEGVNEYLQWLSDDVVIGLGRNTQTNNNFTSFQGIMVSLYNRNDDNSFYALEQITMGEWRAFSEALHNPRAIVNDTARNMFSIPITMWLPNYSGGNVLRPRIEGQGLAVFAYDLDNQTLTKRGLLSNFPSPHTFDNWRDLDYHSFSFVQRGARIGNRIFTISDRFITSYCINTLEQLERVTLTLNICSLLGCDMPSWTYVSHACCIYDGERYTICRRCNRELRQTLNNWGGPRFNEWSISTLPGSSLQNGEETRRCVGGNCGTIETRVLEGHSNANGLILRRNFDTNSYSVRTFMGRPMGAGNALSIPAYHNGVPITSIEERAFVNVNSTHQIASITIGRNIKYIGSSAFSTYVRNNTAALRTVLFENGSQLNTIKDRAFAGTNITAIILPNSLVTIEDSAFFNVMNLASIRIPNSVEYIGRGAFGSNRNVFNPSWRTGQSMLSTLTFESGSRLNIIGEGAFSNTRIRSVVIPNSLTHLGANAFSTATNSEIEPRLTSVSFESGSNLETIGNNAFFNSRITSILIPNSVTNIGNSAFSRVSTLQAVQFASGSNLKTIGNSAFSGTNIASITIPKSVVSIGSEAFSLWTSTQAQGWASNLESIEFENGSQLTSIGSNAFAGSRLVAITLPRYLTSIASGLFNQAGLLQRVNFENGGQYIASIGSSAFSRTGLLSIDIPQNVQSIGSSAFYNINTLTSIVVPDSVLTIGSRAFGAMQSLITLHISANISSIGQGIIYWSPNLVNLTMTSNSYYRFVGKTIIRNADDAAVAGTRVSIISNCVRIVDSFAFAGMNLIGTLVIPYSVVSIGHGAFQGNDNLQHVYIEQGSNLIAIGSSAFSGNTSLKSFNLENARQLMTIGHRAFFNTYQIARLYIPTSVFIVEPWAFDGWIDTQTIVVLGTINTLQAVIKLGVNWIAGNWANIVYQACPDFDFFEHCSSMRM